MKQKTIYLYRVSDRVYTIYKLSNYGHQHIKEVASGLAYDNSGNLSKNFNKALEKYDIDKYQRGTHSTTT